MEFSQLPLNALRAFEASARLGSFTKAGLELRVSQTAISHQVKALEATLGVSLFERLARGVALTDEGQTLLPVLSDVFRRLSAALSRFENGNFKDVLTVGVVSTFANGWLIRKLADFVECHPGVDLRLKTNNNRADLMEDGLDYFIRFGDGAWHGTNAVHLMEVPFSPVCAPQIADRLIHPGDLLKETLLRSYRVNEWSQWFRDAGVPLPSVRGWMFDSSVAMVGAAAQGAGVALVPVSMFDAELRAGHIRRPFSQAVTLGSYWLTWLKSRHETPVMWLFRNWLQKQLEQDGVLFETK